MAGLLCTSSAYNRELIASRERPAFSFHLGERLVSARICVPARQLPRDLSLPTFRRLLRRGTDSSPTPLCGCDDPSFSRRAQCALLSCGCGYSFARCVYAVMARYVYQGATVKIGQRRIASLLGVHVETVNVALHELADTRHLDIRGRGKARRIYHLCSSVFGQKQGFGIEEVISSPSRTPRLASTRRT